MSIREQYRRERCVVLPVLLASDEVGRLEHASRDLPGRRVTVDSDEYTEWEELDISSRPDLTGIYSTEPVLRAVCEALDRGSLEAARVRCWANRYREGEHIAPHRDANGSVQLLICLKAPTSEASGGILHVRTPLGVRSYPLAPGDGVLWEATTIEHWTTPLVATSEDLSPERLVLVGRYFM